MGRRSGRRRYSAPIAFAGVLLFVVGVSCHGPMSTDATKRSALVGDPIESVQQVEGVAPVAINNTTFPPDGGSIGNTSFTIGLFDEDDATLCQALNNSVGHGENHVPFATTPCAILADLDPLHRGDYRNPGIAYPFLEPFDDVSVVEVAVNVGTARTMQWDWTYKAYYQAPFGEFWVEVVDENGQTTTVIDRTAAPAPWGFRPDPNAFIPGMPAFSTGPHHINLDLTRWSGRKIRVRFILHSNYDPNFFTFIVFVSGRPFPINTGAYDAGASKVYIDNLSVDACAVTSVELEELDSPLDPNPNYAGGGLRIFPDKRSPDDQTDRSLVRVVAHAHPHCSVRFRAVDVDDVSPIDSDSGRDNYGGCGSFPEQGGSPACAGTVEADDNGLAIATYSVARQPGDNVVIVAGADSDAVAGVTTRGTHLFDRSGAVLDANSPVKMGPMLTVWRRLHIERDSMGAVTGNHVSAAIAGVRQSAADTLQVMMNRGLFAGRFEDGRLVVGALSFPIKRSDQVAVYIATPTPTQLQQLRVGTACTIYDDDDFNQNDGATLHGDEGEDVPAPDTNLLNDSDVPERNVFAAAYIRPTYDLGIDGAAPFVLNTPEDSIPGIRSLFAAFDRRDKEADPDFWTIYMLGGYEHVLDQANDPFNPTDAVLGLSDVPDGISGGGLGLVTFREAITDVGEDALDNAATTAAHEIGHLFGAEHGQDGLMGDEDGIHTDSTEFRYESLQRIRRALSP